MSPWIKNPIDWYPVGFMSKSQVQSEQSYLEQNMTLKICKKSVDKYCNIMTHTNLKESVVIRGHPGSGNNFCMLYITLYIMPKGFNSTGKVRI